MVWGPLLEIAPEGGLTPALWRGLSIAGSLSVFGALLFRVQVADPALRGLDPARIAGFTARWRGCFAISVALALLGRVGWALVTTRSMADTIDLSATLAVLPRVLTETMFGRISVLSLIAILGAAVASGTGRRRRLVATAFAAVATLLQAGHGHGAAMTAGVSWPLLSLLLHLLASGAWLGGLVPLWLLISSVEPARAEIAAKRFSTLGTLCVAALAVTASYQFWELIGGLAGLIGTAYGLLALFKLVLFVGLLALAAVNRFRFTPALSTRSGATASSRLRRAIVIETALGLLILLAAGLLGSLAPAMHTQARWPFPWRPSLELVEEDHDFRLEVIRAGLAIAGAALLLGTALLARRLRAAAVAVAVIIAWFALPKFDLLFAPAYPTSFFQSPTGFAPRSISLGASLYPTRCAACHGAGGHGDGPEAANLSIPPADLTADHLWMHPDGELFWWLSHGIQAPDGDLVMPGFGDGLGEDELWALIDYARALNAGALFRRDRGWTRPIQAPDLGARCGDHEADVAGHFVRLVFGERATPSPGVVTVFASPASGQPPERACFAPNAAVGTAFSTLTGLGTDQLVGAEVLIDDQGWLRLVHRPGDPGDWNDAAVLEKLMDDIRAHPFPPMAGMRMAM